MAETPRLAHLMVLLFLGSAFGTSLGVLVLLYGAIRKRKLPMQMGATLSACCAGGYAIVLLGTGILSSNTILARGEWKYFCEADCHIAYSIVSVHTGMALRTESNLVQAKGEYVVVRLKTWFDEKSISKFRGDAPLRPDPRLVVLVDAGGSNFSPVQLKSGVPAADSTALSQPLRPGESYLTSFAFDVPKQARDLRLLVADDDPVSKFVIDHENSLLHGKIYLSLDHSPESAQNARR